MNFSLDPAQITKLIAARSQVAAPRLRLVWCVVSSNLTDTCFLPALAAKLISP